ncbi:MlaD family protein [Jannaschia aquimarina]|uniref:Mce related protein n=1 Tax=Jannaschia aquimarina TaxID=935700 RepID=A0A0D1D2M6_9RHOB|nr:MlaD family protein [Jannaschia aquimarina]KIT14323.1 mce related protein [Jannaschia aquimarina]SNS86081.1 phospholipid/cholesterol/gamma-HCH transport system substrate-binding protein [Jannaschia aquimarina]
MEIKANFLLIGAFTLAGLGAILAAFLWLGAVRIDRDVDRYGILFSDVSGLPESGEVVFNGLPVGRVVNLRLHDPNPSLIYVEIEIDAATPVRADTLAQLTIQGVTGVAYIALIGGTTDAPPLPAREDGPPLIPSRRAGLQSLMDDVPDLIEEASALVADLRAIAGPETRQQVRTILGNVESASAKLDSTLDGMDALTAGLSDAATQIAGLGDTIGALEGDVRTTLGNADAALVAVTEAVDAVSPALERVDGILEAGEAVLAQDLPDTLTVWRGGGAGLGDALSSAEAAFAALDTAAQDVSVLSTGDGAALLAAAREATEAATPAIRDDLPALMSDLRAAADETRMAVGRISDNLTAATGQLDPLATDARAALAEAQEVLDRAGPVLDTLDRALASADGAFVSATEVIETDIGPALTDLRTASAAVARDLPGLTRQAEAVLTDIGGAVRAVSPALRTFGTSTLPQIDRFASEARGLVRQLSDLFRQIERNPARFIQGGQVPEYRR